VAKDPNMARIALLPLETVCQGNKRLQATRLARDSENAFLRTHVFRENHACKMETGFWKDCAGREREQISSFPTSLPNCRSSNRRDRMRKWPKPRETPRETPSKTRLPQAHSRMAIAF
jgi:hypothetical protein